MKRIANAMLTGPVLSISDKPGDPAKDKKPYRLVRMSQLSKDGDAETVEIKIYNGMKIEVGKVASINCSLSAWMMKGDRGDYLYGLTATAIEGR